MIGSVVIDQFINDLYNFFIQVYDMIFELNEVEVRQEEYFFIFFYLKLFNVLIENELDGFDKGGRYV